MDKAEDEEFGVPDDESPEITEEQWKWAVHAVDFPDFDATSIFVEERELFLRAAAKAGIARETFLSFAPNKPGFIQRATDALEAAARAGRMHAAE